MNCRTARRAMDRPEEFRGPDLERHLDECDGCRKLKDALDAAGSMLKDRHAGVVPDAAFATRIRARLHRDPAQVLGTAALRLLPVTAIILVLLTWMAFTATPVSDAVVTEAPTEDVLAWLLEAPEDGS